MRILLITDLIPLENSSEPTTIKEFAKNWLELGHQVDVIRPNFLFNTIVRKKKIFPEKVYREDDLTIYNVNCFTPFLFNVKDKLPKDFQIGNYNAVISHMPSGALFAMKLIDKCAGIPYVCSVHASDIAVLTKPIYKPFFAKKLQQAYKRADFISARSHTLAEKIKEISPYAEIKTFVAPSGIEKEKIEPVEFFEQKLTKRNPQFIITTVAKLIRRKNIDVIIKALSKVNIDNVKLRIIGEGPELQNLKNLVKQYHLENKVVFTGYLPNKEVLVQLRNSDLFVLVSSNETFGMAYLEAGSRANVVISSHKDGLDGIIKNGFNGFTCTPNPEQLAKVIEKVYYMTMEDKKRILFNMRKTLIENDSKTVSKGYLARIGIG